MVISFILSMNSANGFLAGIGIEFGTTEHISCVENASLFCMILTLIIAFFILNADFLFKLALDF